MPLELIYTSAPEGLFSPGGGYRTVAATRGIGKSWIERLERLSGYTEAYKPGDTSAGINPVAWSHWRFTVNARRLSVLSRVASVGGEHTGRTNVIAHHIALEPQDTPPRGGPALALDNGPFLTEPWSGPPKHREGPPSLPTQDESRFDAPTWKALTGDAGWAGVLAEAALRHQEIALIYPPETDVLALYREAIALLPPADRWEVTFTTYAMSLPRESECLWRGYPAGSARVAPPVGDRARRIDLTTSLGEAQGGGLVEAARAGCIPRDVEPRAGWVPARSGPTAEVKPSSTPTSEQDRKLHLSEPPSIMPQPSDGNRGISSIARSEPMTFDEAVNSPRAATWVDKVSLVVAAIALIVSTVTWIESSSNTEYRTSGVTPTLKTPEGTSSSPAGALPPTPESGSGLSSRATHLASAQEIDRLDSLQRDLAQLRSKAASLASEVTEFRAAMGAVSLDASKVQGRIPEITESVQSSLTALNELTNSLKSLRERQDSLDVDVRQMQERIRAFPEDGVPKALERLQVTAKELEGGLQAFLSSEMKSHFDRIRKDLLNAPKAKEIEYKSNLGDLVDSMNLLTRSQQCRVVVEPTMYVMTWEGSPDFSEWSEKGPSVPIKVSNETQFLPCLVANTPRTRVVWKLPEESVEIYWEKRDADATSAASQGFAVKYKFGVFDDTAQEARRRTPAVLLLVYDASKLQFRRFAISAKRSKN